MVSLRYRKEFQWSLYCLAVHEDDVRERQCLSGVKNT